MEPFPRKKRLDINAEIFERHAEIECRNDLIDPLIDICSVEVCDYYIQWIIFCLKLYSRKHRRSPLFSLKTLIGNIYEAISSVVY